MDAQQVREKLIALSAVPNHKLFFDYFRRCRNGNQSTSLDTPLKFYRTQGVEVSMQTALSFFRELEALDFGKLFRSGGHHRFEWKEIRCKDLEKIIDGQRDYAAPEMPVAAPARTVLSQEIQFADHTFPLRTNLVIKFRLPLDLTQRDTERINKFISSLALPG